MIASRQEEKVGSRKSLVWTLVAEPFLKLLGWGRKVRDYYARRASARALLALRQRRGALLQRRIPAQGATGYVNWPVTTLAPREQKRISVDLEVPFVLDWFVLCPGELEKLSVVDLRSGETSLFVSVGPYPATVFREGGLFAPTFGRVLTRLGEKLALEVANLSDDVVTLRSGFCGRGFESREDGEAYLTRTGHQTV